MITKEDHNAELFLRPRFSLDIDQKKEKVLAVLLDNIKTTNSDYRLKVSDNHVFINVPKKDAHYWSPQLHFKVVEEEGQTKIKGLFGPESRVWTLFIFIHFVIATSFIGFSILFYVNYKFGGNIIFPVVMMVSLPIVWFLLYFIGQIGRQTGKGQMEKLKNCMRKSLKDVI